MSQNNSKHIEEFINAVVISFITTTILFVGRNVIQLLNDKIEKLNDEVERLKTLVDVNNDKQRFHLLEIVAENKDFKYDFEVKYNDYMLAVNANIESQIATAIKQQDKKINELYTIIDELTTINGVE
jgi:uncharacterized membrane protein YhiD involved in acid resistance